MIVTICALTYVACIVTNNETEHMATNSRADGVDLHKSSVPNIVNILYNAHHISGYDCIL